MTPWHVPPKSEVERLRALLAEAREWVRTFGEAGCPADQCEQCAAADEMVQRIDAALAEPVKVEYSQDEVNEMTTDMIAIRKEAERAAFKRGAEAMREAVLYRLNPDPLKSPLVRGFSLWDEIKHTPIPEDKR